MRSPNNNGGNNNHHRRNNNQRGRHQNGGNGGNNNNRRPHQQQNLRNQIFDSHGPGGERVRGNAFQVHEKYLSLAREAEERIDQENYHQHAEHYYRIIEAIQEMEAEQRSRFQVVESDPFTMSDASTSPQPGLQAETQTDSDSSSDESSAPIFSISEPTGNAASSDQAEEPSSSPSDDGGEPAAPRTRGPRPRRVVSA